METTRHRAVRTAIADRAGSFRRRGLGYVYFVSTMMLIAVIAVSALICARIQLRTAGAIHDSTTARFHAQSAIELGLVMIEQDAGWRSTLADGTWFSDQPIGSGTMSLKCTTVSDADGNPKNNAVVFVGTGVNGQATYHVEVTLETLSDKGGMVIATESWKRAAP